MSSSASITSWLTEGSLKKAAGKASLWIPLINFAAHVCIYGSTYCCHVGTILGRAPQLHAVGHARCYAGQEDEQFRCRTLVLAAQAATDAVQPSRWPHQLLAERPSLLLTQGAALRTLLCPRWADGTHPITVEGRRAVRTMIASRIPLPPTWAR